MRRMFIGGEFATALAGETFAVENPSTEETIDEVPRARAEDAEAAVRAAHAAWDDWRFTPGIEKCEMLHEAARRIRERREELAKLLTLEGGKPLIENMDEVEWVAACFDYYAEVGRHEAGRVIPPVQRHQMNFVVKEPYGVVVCIVPWNYPLLLMAWKVAPALMAGNTVVVCIVPWNYPLLLMAWKVAPALMAGNTVVIKPSEHTPLSTLLLTEVAFEDLPPGVVNVLTGYGDEVGEPLVRHPLPPVIAFTGSVATGRRIATLAAERVKRVNLELGGNDPFIICDDVDLDVAVRGAVWAAYLNMGQVCTSGERFYVFESVADRFIRGFVEFTGKLRLGDPVGPDVDLGPLISAAQREKGERELDRVREMGAEVLCGGKRPEKFSRGYFFEPTVVTHVDHTM